MTTGAVTTDEARSFRPDVHQDFSMGARSFRMPSPPIMLTMSALAFGCPRKHILSAAVMAVTILNYESHDLQDGLNGLRLGGTSERWRWLRLY
jgi:hypothetical protein